MGINGFLFVERKLSPLTEEVYLAQWLNPEKSISISIRVVASEAKDHSSSTQSNVIMKVNTEQSPIYQLEVMALC